MWFVIKHFDTKQNSDNKEVNLAQNEEARSETGQSLYTDSEIFWKLLNISLVSFPST